MNKPISNIDILASKRTGGAINIQGIYYQFYYSCKTLLDNLNHSNIHSIRLEGIEDVDIINQISVGQSTYIQLKYSKNKLSASELWNKGVIQNYLEVYLGGNTECNFKLAHNNQFSDKNIIAIQNKRKSTNELNYWETKINEFKEVKGQNYDWSNFIIGDFFDKILVEIISIEKLHEEIIKQLNTKFKITFGNTGQYLKALFYHIFLWSISRIEVTHSDIEAIINSVSEDIIKGSLNPAIQNSWLERINFNIESQKNVNDYFDGKPARPNHIVQNLPIKRKKWEQIIFDSIQSNDVTVVKASSGQGKSTLVWQIAKRLFDNQDLIYELIHCEEKYIGSLIEIIEKKASNGNTIYILIDGLNNSTANWATFAERISEQIQVLPVKFLITTREEDWNRYGSFIHKLKVDIVNIGLNQSEAQDIFRLLKDKKKLSNNIQNWQTAWERVADKQLLIEYIYLLTKGQMLSSRIEEQVKSLRNYNESAIITTILKVVSLADICNIKILNTKLTTFIENKFNNADIGNIYDLLEKEYYLKFNNTFVEGLHPIRSKHLVEILHKNYPLQNTFLQLVSIVEENAVYDFTIQAFELLDKSEFPTFLDKLADSLIDISLVSLIQSLNGIYHQTTKNYWIDNKEVFDAAFETGGLLLFVYDTIPFANINIIENSEEILGSNGNKLIGLLDRLSPFDIENSISGQYLKIVRNKLITKKHIIKVAGLGSLIFWIGKIYENIPIKVTLDDDFINVLFNELEIDEAKDLASAVYDLNQSDYQKFISENRDALIGLLKIKTSSIDISEIKNEIKVKYILGYNELDTLNKQSVNRLETIRAFLPVYEQYCTEVIIPPLIPQNIIPSVLVEANGNKHITKEYLPNRFNIKLNNIWRETILNNYSAKSIYEWQVQWYEKRTLSYKYASYITRILENALERNYNKADSLIKEVNQIRKKYLGLTLKEFPNKSKFNEELGKISDWNNYYHNFLVQSIHIINNENPHSQSLAKLDLNNSICKLHQMQSVFEYLFNETFRYDEISDKKTINEIELKERQWYERLQRVIHFWEYKKPFTNPLFIIDAKSEVLEWWDNINAQRLTNVKEIIRQFEEDNFRIAYISPKIDLEEYDVKNLNIGIEVPNFDSFDSIIDEILKGLYRLGKLDLTSYTFMFLNVNEVWHLGIRIPKETFQVAEQIINTAEYEDTEFRKPYPINLSTRDIAFIGNVKLRNQIILEENNIAFEVLDNLWQFDEYRKYTIDNVSIEREWLKKKKDNIQKVNQANIRKLENVYSFERLEELKKLNNEVLELNSSFKMDKVSFILGVPENTFS